MIQELPTSTPSLRFPFFKGKVWNKCLLQNIAAPVTDKANFSCTDPVLTLSCEYGLIIQKNYFEKNIHSSNLSRYIKVQNNDFVYNDRVTNLYPYGTIKRNTLNIKGLVSPIYKCFRFFTKTEPAFWQYYFEAHCHENELKNIINEGARTGRFNISIKQFLKISVFLPDKAEQKKIADCLSSLDELIEAHEQKLDALKQHKKGLMQRLFPAEGETTPRWRFPEFRHAGEWEKRVLKEHCHVITGGTPSRTKENYWDGNIPWISSRHISDMHTILGNEYISKEGLENSSTNIIPKNSTLLVTRVSVGKYTITSFDIAINQDITALIPYDINYKFLFFYSEILAKMIKNSAVGTGVVGVSQSFFDMISIYCPNSLEQQKIADCLFALDEHIKAQEEKIAALKEHKKGLMQKLFPSL